MYIIIYTWAMDTARYSEDGLGLRLLSGRRSVWALGMGTGPRDVKRNATEIIFKFQSEGKPKILYSIYLLSYKYYTLSWLVERQMVSFLDLY